MSYPFGATIDRNCLAGYFPNPANLNYITEVKITEVKITQVEITELKSRKASSTSLLPPGIINGMNEDEVRDLLSGCDAKSKVFP